MIKELLEANYLDAIGDDDVKLSHVTKAAGELRDDIAKRPGQIVPLTLIALDPDGNPQDDLLVATENRLKKHWQTYSNKFRDERPVQLLRAIIIEALSMVADGSINFAAAIWYTGSAYLSHKNAKNEQDLLVGFLKGLGAKVESAVVRQWSFSSDGKQLKQLVEDAIAETNGTAPSFDGTLTSALGSLWSAETSAFDPKKASSVANAVHSDIESAVDVAFAGLNKPLIGLSKLVATEILKNKLLWWKETKYSETLGRSYRTCDEFLIGPVMARELQMMLPELHPVSVEYFLSESVAELLSADRKASIFDLANGTVRSLISTQLGNADPVSSFPSLDGRNSVVGLINQCRSAGKITKADLKRNLNIDPTSEISFSDFAVWCFKDMQAFRLINSGGRKKK